MTPPPADLLATYLRLREHQRAVSLGPRALLVGAGAGVVGALANALAIRLVHAAGVDPGAGGLAQWILAHLHALGLATPATLGPIGQQLFHTAVGLFTGIAYVLARPLIPLRPLARGVAFVQPMWLVQALVILPWLEAVPFGAHRGPATIVASFLLNAFFGVVLGFADATLLRSRS